MIIVHLHFDVNIVSISDVVYHVTSKTKGTGYKPFNSNKTIIYPSLKVFMN